MKIFLGNNLFEVVPDQLRFQSRNPRRSRGVPRAPRSSAWWRLLKPKEQTCAGRLVRLETANRFKPVRVSTVLVLIKVGI